VISGAGPSLLALCKPDSAPAVSQAMVRAWHQAGVESRSEVLAIQQEGSSWLNLPDKL
jgi:homoserine kinase